MPGLGITRAVLITSVRTTLAAVAAMLIARMFSLPEFYWAPISAIVIVLSTIPPRTLAWQRFAGTALGAVVGAILATFFHPHGLAYAWVPYNWFSYEWIGYALGVFACGLLCPLLRIPGAYRFAAITVSIVLLIAHTRGPWIVALHRFIEVSIGIAVALIITVAWPAPA
jgi:uncharacterized membrane protein YgaE (UPF0421/DUF939 family)